jgi:chromosome segregation ATPase
MGKQIREQHSKVQKQKERLLRELKRAETQFRNVKDELASANMTIEKLQLKVNINEFHQLNFRSANR